MEKVINEKLDQFLYALEDFVQINAEYITEDLKIVYLTQWQEGKGKMYARGTAKIGSAYYPFELVYNVKTNRLVIRSPIFLFRVSFEDIEDFLAQGEKE